MIHYILRRLALFVVALFVTSAVIFGLVRILPGDVAQVIGGIKATPDQLAQIRVAYGLDQPLPDQYIDWVRGLAKWDLGNSLVTGSSISAQLGEKFAVTLPLCALAVALSIGIGIPVGVWAGLHHDTAAGRAVAAAAQALASVPVLWAGLLLVVVFAQGVGLVGLFPSQGFPQSGWAQPGRALRCLALPALTIAIVEGAVIVRFVRSAVLEALPQDYLRTAAAKGLTRTQALLRFGLPNVSLSVLPVIALQAASMITGAIVVETLFDLPGIGSMLVGDVANRDLIKVQSEVLVLVAIVLVVGLLLDVAQRLVDPRLRRAGAGA